MIIAFVAVVLILDCLNDDVKPSHQKRDFQELPGHPCRFFLRHRQLEAMMEKPAAAQGEVAMARLEEITKDATVKGIYLDQGYGSCVLRNSLAADTMQSAMLKFQGIRYVTSSFCVMPNHVHLCIKPLDGFELEDILEGVKGATSRKINRDLGQSGQRWEQESAVIHELWEQGTKT